MYSSSGPAEHRLVSSDFIHWNKIGYFLYAGDKTAAGLYQGFSQGYRHITPRCSVMTQYNAMYQLLRCCTGLLTYLN